MPNQVTEATLNPLTYSERARLNAAERELESGLHRVYEVAELGGCHLYQIKGWLDQHILDAPEWRVADAGPYISFEREYWRPHTPEERTELEATVRELSPRAAVVHRPTTTGAGTDYASMTSSLMRRWEELALAQASSGLLTRTPPTVPSNSGQTIQWRRPVSYTGRELQYMMVDDFANESPNL